MTSYIKGVTPDRRPMPAFDESRPISWWIFELCDDEIAQTNSHNMQIPDGEQVELSSRFLAPIASWISCNLAIAA